MAKIVIMGAYAKSLINFRGELIKSFVEKGYEVVALGPEKGYEEKLGNLGARYIQYNLNRAGLNPIKDLKSLKEIINIFKKEKPDIVFNYAIKPVIYGSITARFVGINNVYSMITGLGYVFTGNSLKQRIISILVQLLYKIGLKNNKVIFFQNPDDLKVFKNLKLLTKKTKTIIVNGSGVNTKKFAPVENIEENISFMLIARLLFDKGIREYYEAGKIIKKRYPNISLKLLGPLDPNPASISKETIDKWVDEGIIEYLGETNDVRPFIAKSSVYVLPSYREGTPRSVLEAMSMGKPIITTDAPGCRETVINGENGFLVPVKNTKAIAEAMEKFIINPELIEIMGIKSRDIAVQKYDVHKVNQLMMSQILWKVNGYEKNTNLHKKNI